MDTAYVASQPSQYRVAEPPRLVVPPPTVEYVNNRPSMRISGLQSYDYNDEFGDPDFLRLHVGQDAILDHRMLEWNYEERRQAQPILPFLYLGPSSSASDKDFLQKAGITLLMPIRQNDSLQARLLTPLTRGKELGIESAIVTASTAPELVSKLPSAIKAINDHLKRRKEFNQIMPATIPSHEHFPGKVLVFCESGNERSPSIVLGYLMAMYNLSTIQAVHAVQSQRFCVSADESVKQMLLDFEVILKAKRDVATNDRNLQQRSSTSTGKRHKRSLDTVYDSDEDMSNFEQHSEDIGRHGRAGSAPFRDREGS